MNRKVLLALLLLLALPISASLVSAQTTPEFSLGFKALADQIPDVVGAPLENEHFNVSNGNSEQHTTTGLMVWRKADNWTAFTNGSMTWVNGPSGVQFRLNEERFSWESDAIRPSMQASLPTTAITGVPRAAAAAAPTAAPTASPTQAPAASAPTAAPTAAPTQPPAPPAAPTTNTAGTSTDACLSCHGPFDKLVSATAGYVWPNGDKQTPHRYVPHDSKNVPACSECHKAHPLPPTASDLAAMGKPSTQYCFTCHHTGALTCGNCHAIP